MKQENNLVKYLVPIVAVIVLIESVLLINNLRNRNLSVKNSPQMVTAKVTASVPTKPAVKAPVYSLEIVSSTKEMKVGVPATMEVTMTGNSARALDALDLYLKFNASAFDVTNLSFDKKFPVPAFAKVSTTKNLIVANFLVSNPSGLKLDANEKISLAKFQIRPKVSGNFDFEISTGNEAKESVTMFVENATAGVLPFVSNKLTVNVL